MMTIGQVLDSLGKAAKPDLPVYFAFGDCIPTTVGSWRGVYAEAALGFTLHRPPPTVAQLRRELETAIDGRTFTGYKGGEYRYTRDTVLHVDNCGICSHTEIDRIELDDYLVRVHTIHDDPY